MPQWMIDYLNRHSVRSHFARALFWGLLFRLVCAYFVYGPQALDDYKHGVYPAYQFFAGLPLDLPEYRSHILIWLLAGFLKVGSLFSGLFDTTSALAQVRIMYAGLGIVSLLGICGTYQFVRREPSKVFAGLALYMVALFPVMPFVSTRAFGEAVALNLVLLGFGFLEPARRHGERSPWPWLAGFLVLGLATYFRFHVGLIYFVYIGCLVFQQRVRPVIWAMLAGVLIVLGQFWIDWLSHKPPFGTLLAYIAANEGGAAQYGVSPWYNTWLFVLVLTLPPFSFVLVKSLRSLWRSEWTWLVPLLLYVLLHSLVPHKEERFLYPIVGLEIWALAWLWANQAQMAWTRRIYASAVLVITAIVLPVICLVNTQEGEIEPPAYAESRYHEVIYLDYQSLFGMSRVQFYFLRPPSEIYAIEREGLNAHRVDEAMMKYPRHRAVVLLTSHPDARDTLYAMQSVRTLHSQCGEMRTAGSLLDRLIYKLNPAHNQRRRPTWYLVCERTPSAETADET